MEQTLKALQALQLKAFEKGIHSFEVTARYFEPDLPEDEREARIHVTIFFKGDDSVDDYYSNTFYSPSKYGVAEIAERIGENPQDYV